MHKREARLIKSSRISLMASYGYFFYLKMLEVSTKRVFSCLAIIDTAKNIVQIEQTGDPGIQPNSLREINHNSDLNTPSIAMSSKRVNDPRLERPPEMTPNPTPRVVFMYLTCAWTSTNEAPPSDVVQCGGDRLRLRF